MFYENIKIIENNEKNEDEEEMSGSDRPEEDFQREYEEKGYKIDDHD